MVHPETSQQTAQKDAQAAQKPQNDTQPTKDAKSHEAGAQAAHASEKVALPPAKDTERDGKPDGRSKTSAENGKKGGRPKGSVNESTRRKQMVRQILEKRVQEELEPLIEAKFDLAKGHFMYITKHDPKTGKEIVEKVYKRSPDSKSLEYLLDQVIGKPTSPIEVTEPQQDEIVLSDEEEAKIHYVLKNLRKDRSERIAELKEKRKRYEEFKKHV